MLNYISAELYKVRRGKGLWGILWTMLGLEILFTVFLILEATETTVSDSIMLTRSLLILGLFFACMVDALICGDTFKHNILKNEVCSGVSRTKVYLGKLWSALLLGVFLCVLLVGCYVMICYVFLVHGPGDRMVILTMIWYLVSVFPLWIGTLSICHLLVFITKSSGAAVAITSFAIWFLPTFLFVGQQNGVDFSWIGNLSPVAPFLKIEEKIGLHFFLWCWSLGLSWLAATSVLGLHIFRRQEL